MLQSLLLRFITDERTSRFMISRSCRRQRYRRQRRHSTAAAAAASARASTRPFMHFHVYTALYGLDVSVPFSRLAFIKLDQMRISSDSFFSSLFIHDSTRRKTIIGYTVSDTTITGNLLEAAHLVYNAELRKSEILFAKNIKADTTCSNYMIVHQSVYKRDKYHAGTCHWRMQDLFFMCRPTKFRKRRLSLRDNVISCIQQKTEGLQL